MKSFKYDQAQVRVAATVISVILGSKDVLPKILRDQDKDYHLHFLVKVYATPSRPSPSAFKELQNSFLVVALNPPSSYKLSSAKLAKLRELYRFDYDMIWQSSRVKNLTERLEVVSPEVLASWCYSSTIPSLSVAGECAAETGKITKADISHRVQEIAQTGYRAMVSSWIAGIETPSFKKPIARPSSEVAVSDYLSGMWSSSGKSDDEESSGHTVVPRSQAGENSILVQSQGSSATSYSASIHTGISTEYVREEAVHTRLLRQGSAVMTGHSSSILNSDIVHATENFPHDDETSHADFDSFGFSDTEDSSKVQSLEEENRTLRRTLFKSRKALKRTWDGRMALERHLAYEYRRGGIHRVVLDQIARNLGRAPFGSKHSRRRIRLSRLA